MALAPVAFAISAFSVAAIISGINLKQASKDKTTAKTLGVIVTLAGIAIFMASLLMITTTPYGSSYPAANVQLMFSLLMLIFAFVWITFGMTLLYNWDMKFIGDMTMVLFVFNLIAVIALFFWNSGYAVYSLADFAIVEITLISYLFDEVGFFALTHGKMKASLQSGFLIASGVLSILLAVTASGIIPL
ncbi:MAG: hypothetical protein BJBARM4_0276 [Candidatus Parvarchaeum acidiphilum ARMAN-4]|jgi:hypothetical protein|uniref:Uncharacterized protein n=1 Tax=Candidatus Parvarchaeum acidiphilum ARMAN-4 TaxID=662760 RepID=D2EEX4_PARA4|nr:MAG: hypothetical protein BJBARM4_0276 [Candidatus Parvarchaeum acidiphilum ARMAN-4]